MQVLIDSKDLVILSHHSVYVCFIQPLVTAYASFKIISCTPNF